jgi:hypothetical protein
MLRRIQTRMLVAIFVVMTFVSSSHCRLWARKPVLLRQPEHRSRTCRARSLRKIPQRHRAG